MSDRLEQMNIKGLEDWRSPEVIRAAKLQQPVSVLKALGGVRPGQQVVNAGAFFQVRLFKVVRLEEDVIIANFTDGTTDGTDEVKIAMPYLMRKTAFATGSDDGRFTYTYTFTDDNTGLQRFDKRTSIDSQNDDDEEIQVIVGAYTPGNLFFAARGIFGNTGLFHDDAKTQPIVWQDENKDARFWALSSETEPAAEE